MSLNLKRTKQCSRLLVGGALLAAGLTVFSCKDKYDLDSKQPEGLNSIYGYLTEQGNYTNYLHLIDDLGQSEILSKTGSKTMFAADDEAFARFFKGENNPWGVTSYSQLTLAQKKLLLKSSMIDNPYTSSMLSTATGPVKGEVCRRISSLSLMDSVPVYTKTSPELPQNEYFRKVMIGRDKIVMLNDPQDAGPMVHFTTKFLNTNMLQSTDVDFIYNQKQTGATPFQSDDVFVNNARVIERDIFCKNGFIHKVDKVVSPLDNMAEIVRKNPNSKQYSSIIERFATPIAYANLTNEYGTGDTVFVKRYLSKASYGSTEDGAKMWNKDPFGNEVSTTALLKFDPGWNGYYPQATSKGGNGLMEDMGVMIVPTDEALNAYFLDGGKDIMGQYNSLKNIPTELLYPLVNVNMLPSFVTSVPSKFNEVLDDANESMEITTDDIDHVEIGCNGVVYFTKKVFAPKSYSTVLFPILVDENHKVVRKAIEELVYDAYLNSTSAQYTFLIPSFDKLTYLDPVSFATGGEPRIWEFVWDDLSQNFYAKVYKSRKEGDAWVKDGETPISTVGYDTNNKRAYGVGTTKVDGNALLHVWGGDNNNAEKLHNRIVDILDNLICVETYGDQPGKEYYRTKGNSFVRIFDGGHRVAGSGQDTWGTSLSVEKEIKGKKNGTAYIVDGIVMGSNLSVCSQLAKNPEFSDFLQLIKDANAVSLKNDADGWTAADQTIGNLLNVKDYGVPGAEKAPAGVTAKTVTTYFTNNYHYTVYAPTNEAMRKAYQDGLPTHQDLQDAIMYDRDMNEIFKQEALAAGKKEQDKFSHRADTIREIMLDFFKYHIHDNSVFIDGGASDAVYTTAKTRFLEAFSAAEFGDYSYVDKNHIMIGDKIYETRNDIPSNWYSSELTIEYKTGRYTPGRAYELKVYPSSSSMSVVDALGASHDVITQPGFYNIMAREVWIGGKSIVDKAPEELMINNASSVVIQGINTPLYFEDPEKMFHYTYKELAGKQRK